MGEVRACEADCLYQVLHGTAPAVATTRGGATHMAFTGRCKLVTTRRTQRMALVALQPWLYVDQNVNYP